MMKEIEKALIRKRTPKRRSKIGTAEMASHEPCCEGYAFAAGL